MNSVGYGGLSGAACSGVAASSGGRNESDASDYVRVAGARIVGRPGDPKLSVPHQGFVLPRERLHSLVTSLCSGGVVHVVAGPGYGKTAFLSHLLARWNGPSAYLALDSDDVEPGRFFRYLLAVLRAANPDLHLDVDVFGKAGDKGNGERGEPDGDTSPEAALAAVLETAAEEAAGPTLLAFDDLHEVEDSEQAVRLLRLLVASLPRGWMLVLSSRSSLGPELAASRAFIEIGARSLRLTPQEVIGWAASIWGVRLDLFHGRALWRLTEGWPVALVLLGQQIQARSGSAGEADIARFLKKGRQLNRYLSENVFHCLDQEAAHVLKVASPLPRAVFPRDEPFFAAHGAAEAARVFGELTERGFLVAQTGSGIFTLHPLIRAYASRELRRKDAGKAAAFELSAARHLEKCGELMAAVTLYLRAGRARDAVAPLRRLCSSNLDASLVHASREWLPHLPDEIVDGEPWLLAAKAQLVQDEERYEDAAELYGRAGRVLEESEDGEGLVRVLLGRAFCLYMLGRREESLEALADAEKKARHPSERAEALAASGSVLLSKCCWDEAVDRWEMALALAPADERPELQVRSMNFRTRLFFLMGRYGAAESWARRAVREGAGYSRSGTLYPMALNAAATVLYHVGRYEEASVQSEAAMALAKTGGHGFLEAPVHLTQAGIALGKGDVRTARSHMIQARDIAQKTQDVEAEVWATHMLGDWCRRSGSAARALDYHDRALAVAEQGKLAVFERVRVICGRGMDLVHMGRADEAQEVLREAVALGRKWSLVTSIVQAGLYLGWLQAVRGREGEAGPMLREAMRLAEENKHLHFLLQEAGVALPILALCDRYQTGEYVRGFVYPRLSERLQKSFLEFAEGSTYPTDVPLGRPRTSRLELARRRSVPQGMDAALAEQMGLLTGREMEILRLMGEGLPNKIIAGRLFITEKTIKTHTNRIYRKLDVDNRLQAVLALQQYDRVCST